MSTEGTPTVETELAENTRFLVGARYYLRRSEMRVARMLLVAPGLLIVEQPPVVDRLGYSFGVIFDMRSWTYRQSSPPIDHISLPYTDHLGGFKGHFTVTSTNSYEVMFSFTRQHLSSLNKAEWYPSPITIPLT